MTKAELKELKELRRFKATVEPVLGQIYDILYYDCDRHCYNPDKEWAADFIEFIAENVRYVIPLPQNGAKQPPPHKLKKV